MKCDTCIFKGKQPITNKPDYCNHVAHKGWITQEKADNCPAYIKLTATQKQEQNEPEQQEPEPINKAKEWAGELLALIESIEETYQQNYERVNVLDYKQQDILHEIENTSFSGFKGYQLAKDLKETRNERRELKNENMLLKPLFDYLNACTPFVNGLRKVQNQIDKVESKMTDEYIPRVKNDELTAMGEALKKVGFKKGD